MREKFEIYASQVDNYWAIQVKGHSNWYTQSNNQTEIEFMARDMISLMLDVPRDAFDVEVTELQYHPAK